MFNLLHCRVVYLFEKKVLVHAQFSYNFFNPLQFPHGQGLVPGQGIVIFVNETGQGTVLFIRPGPFHRWNEMVDNHSPAPPFCLYSFTNIIHDIGIKIGQILDEDFRGTGPAQACLFPGKPFVGAVFSKMDDCIRLKLRFQPEIKGSILMMWPELGGMIKFHRVITPSPRRLGKKDNISQVHAGYNNFTVPDHYL